MSVTPRPWFWLKGEGIMSGSGDEVVAFEDGFTDDDDVELIVRCVNAHDALVEALNEAKAHVEELEDAWRRGAINEIDGQGGLRSNRNVDVRVAINNALRAAGALE